MKKAANNIKSKRNQENLEKNETNDSYINFSFKIEFYKIIKIRNIESRYFIMM